MPATSIPAIDAPRYRVVRFGVSHAEYALLLTEASDAGLSVSALLRLYIDQVRSQQPARTADDYAERVLSR